MLSARQMALNDVYGRLTSTLTSLATDRGDGTWLIDERLTHRELANRLGCSREMVSRLLKDLEAGRYLRFDNGLIAIERRLPARW